MYTNTAKSYLSGAPAERRFQDEGSQNFHGSAHCNIVQDGCGEQQDHVHHVYAGGSLNRKSRGAGGTREEVGVLIRLSAVYLFHLNQDRHKHI